MERTLKKEVRKKTKVGSGNKAKGKGEKEVRREWE